MLVGVVAAASEVLEVVAGAAEVAELEEEEVEGSGTRVASPYQVVV